MDGSDTTAFFLVESRGPMNGPGCESLLGDALALRENGHPVRLLLIQDGVAAGAMPGTAALLGAGGELWVDEFSLRQRGLTRPLVAGSRLVDMAEVATAIREPGVRVVWH
jgi:hypothetical protein